MEDKRKSKTVQKRISKIKKILKEEELLSARQITERMLIRDGEISEKDKFLKMPYGERQNILNKVRYVLKSYSFEYEKGGSDRPETKLWKLVTAEHNFMK